MRHYQNQAVRSASPEQLVGKLYNLGITACHRGERSKLRAVLVELISSLDFEQGGELANRLYALYEFCLHESVTGDLAMINELFSGLRSAWQEAVLDKAA
jgi:flagellar protein FliS